MIRAILFDLDGVVRRWDWAAERALEREYGLPEGTIQRLAFDPALLGRAVRGEISDDAWRAEVRRAIARDHGQPACAIINRWSAGAGEVDKAVLEIVGAVRPMYRVGLLTNGTTRLRQDMEKLALVGRFDEVINSAETGFEKPTPQAYAIAAQRMGVTPAECLLIDDSPRHVEGARAVGMSAITFQGAENLRTNLRDLGIRV